mgnify:CR=1 FL=1
MSFEVVFSIVFTIVLLVWYRGRSVVVRDAAALDAFQKIKVSCQAQREALDAMAQREALDVQVRARARKEAIENRELTERERLEKFGPSYRRYNDSGEFVG